MKWIFEMLKWIAKQNTPKNLLNTLENGTTVEQRECARVETHLYSIETTAKKSENKANNSLMIERNEIVYKQNANKTATNTCHRKRNAKNVFESIVTHKEEEKTPKRRKKE